MWMSDEQIDRLAAMQLGMEDVGGWKVREAYELAKLSNRTRKQTIWIGQSIRTEFRHVS